jgi:hypothetical protein
MKEILLFVLFVVGLTIQVRSQSVEKDFIVVGKVTGDSNMFQVGERYKRISQVLFAKELIGNGIEQVTNALSTVKAEDLHIFVRNANQGLFLTDVPVTVESIDNFSELLASWKKSIKGKIIIHCGYGNLSDDIYSLKKKLETLTELAVELTY